MVYYVVSFIYHLLFFFFASILMKYIEIRNEEKKMQRVSVKIFIEIQIDYFFRSFPHTTRYVRGTITCVCERVSSMNVRLNILQLVLKQTQHATQIRPRHSIQRNHRSNSKICTNMLIHVLFAVSLCIFIQQQQRKNMNGYFIFGKRKNRIERQHQSIENLFTISIHIKSFL